MVLVVEILPHGRQGKLCLILMAADVLATQRARTSVVMVLTSFCQNIPVSAPNGLINP